MCASPLKLRDFDPAGDRRWADGVEKGLVIIGERPDRLYAAKGDWTLASGDDFAAVVSVCDEQCVGPLARMPADGISLPPKKGTSARPAGAARRLGYINGATGRKGA
jgi:hypothetical protein